MAKTKRVELKFEPELIEWFDKWAASQSRSRNAQIEFMLKQERERQEKAKKKK